MTGYPQPKDPPCPGCEDPRCCTIHGVHHVVEAMARWCERKE